MVQKLGYHEKAYSIVTRLRNRGERVWKKRCVILSYCSTTRYELQSLEAVGKLQFVASHH